MDFGLQVFWACHPFFLVVGLTFLISLSMGLAHCVISLGPGVMIFLDLNNALQAYLVDARGSTPQAPPFDES